MKTNPPSATPTALFMQALAGLLAVLQKAFLPHLAAGIGLFLMTAYVTYIFLLKPLQWPPVLEAVLVACCFTLYALFAFSYSLVTACVFALRAVCTTWDEFIDDWLGLVKQKVASKIENMHEGIAKEQAKVVVAGSVQEVAGLFRQYNYTSWLRWLAAVLLGVLTFALRSVLLAKIVQISGKTVQLGKLFAGRATLVGAVFLNLRLFSTVLLWLLYAGGVFIVLMNFLFVFWLK